LGEHSWLSVQRRGDRCAHRALLRPSHVHHHLRTRREPSLRSPPTPIRNVPRGPPPPAPKFTSTCEHEHSRQQARRCSPTKWPRPSILWVLIAARHIPLRRSKPTPRYLEAVWPFAHRAATSALCAALALASMRSLTAACFSPARGKFSRAAAPSTWRALASWARAASASLIKVPRCSLHACAVHLPFLLSSLSLFRSTPRYFDVVQR
jgi:hypothetical protein